MTSDGSCQYNGRCGVDDAVDILVTLVARVWRSDFRNYNIPPHIQGIASSLVRLGLPSVRRLVAVSSGVGGKRCRIAQGTHAATTVKPRSTRYMTIHGPMYTDVYAQLAIFRELGAPVTRTFPEVTAGMCEVDFV
jgi:hypothetical protein